MGGAPEPSLRFRRLRESDLPEVLAIERRVFNTPWGAGAFRVFLTAGFAFSRVALSGGRVVGYALGWCAGREAELMNLAVHPEWQGRSLGSTLLRWTLATCARRGAAEIYLEVRPSNERAQRLYRRHRFELCARRRDYYRNPREDALVLRRALSRAARD